MLALVVAGGPVACPAQALSLPKGAEMISLDAASLGEVLVPSGPWTAATGLPAQRVTGMVTVQSWRMADGGMSTLALMTTLRADLERDGFGTRFSCYTDDCGGFDFRFSIPALPEPKMHVDLGDFRYLVAQHEGAKGTEYALVLVSRGPGTLYAQITQVSPAGMPPAQPPAQTLGQSDPVPEPLTDTLSDPVADPKGANPPVAQGVGAALVGHGGVALDDLVFAPGAGDLLDGDYASLQELGAWLLANPGAHVVLVGHTDASGGLAANVGLSQRRAEAVRAWLMQRFKVSSDQISAEGVGYLAPRATNQTDAGRAKNRRVEVMLTSTR